MGENGADKVARVGHLGGAAIVVKRDERDGVHVADFAARRAFDAEVRRLKQLRILRKEFEEAQVRRGNSKRDNTSHDREQPKGMEISFPKKEGTDSKRSRPKKEIENDVTRRRRVQIRS